MIIIIMIMQTMTTNDDAEFCEHPIV